MAIYHRIRDLREDSDKTQKELADYLGTSTQHYGKYELGNAEIPFERAIQLAKYYNVSLDYIAGLTNSKRGLSCGDIPPDRQELLQLISELTPAEREKFSALLTAILNSMK